MRKIYPSVPDVAQSTANKAIEIIERHFAANKVRRAQDLPEESKVRLYRELRVFLQSERRPNERVKKGRTAHDRASERAEGRLRSIVNWLARTCRWGSGE